MTSLLEAGAKAPDFELQDGDGKTWRLADLRGRKVILYFYPADDTPGCTAQACDFRDSHDVLQSAGYAVLGVSPQGPDSHRAFATKYSLNFPLLVDADHAVAEAYGVWGEKKSYGRTTVGIRRSTFVIDEDGVIEQALYDVRAKGHVDRLRDAIGA
ncbi:MAG TPA: thioredoxin-dependent thiol peroxidase [Actinomycetota bacterium]|nr:thioredoxin-dependent thiol peroxidase [Actinomycetota bacterium]